MASAGWSRHHCAGLSPWNIRRSSFSIFIHSFLSIFANQSHQASNLWSYYRNRGRLFASGFRHNTAHWRGTTHWRNPFRWKNEGHPQNTSYWQNETHPQDTSHWQNEAHWENAAHRHNAAHWHEAHPHPRPEHWENPADWHNAHWHWHNAHQHWHNVHQHWHNRARAHWQNPAHWQNAARLRAHNHGHLKQAEVTAIINHGGQFGFVQNDPIFSADGWITQTLESLPYVGFVVAVFRKQSGVEDRFRRAMIHASGSTAIALLGTLGGHFGGPLGAALVAGAATPPKMLLEQWAGSTLIADPALRREFAAEAPRRGTYLIETLTNMLAAGSSKQVSQFFAQQAAQLIEALVYPVLQKLGRWAVNKVGGAVHNGFLHKIVEGLVNGTLPDEWLSSVVTSDQLQEND